MVATLIKRNTVYNEKEIIEQTTPDDDDDDDDPFFEPSRTSFPPSVGIFSPCPKPPRLYTVMVV